MITSVLNIKKYVSQIPWNTYVLFLQDLKYRGGYYYAMYGADIVKMFRPKYKVAIQPKYKVCDVWELKFRKDSRRTPCSCARSQVLSSLWNIWYGTKIFSRIWKYLKYLNRWAPLWVNTTSTGGQCSSSAPLVTSSLTWSSRWRPLIGILITFFPKTLHFKLIRYTIVNFSGTLNSF